MGAILQQIFSSFTEYVFYCPLLSYQQNRVKLQGGKDCVIFVIICNQMLYPEYQADFKHPVIFVDAQLTVIFHSDLSEDVQSLSVRTLVTLCGG